MAVITNKSIFFHIPKTGGTWVMESMLKSIPSARKMEHYEGERVRWDGQHVPTDRINHRGRETFTFIRHPLSWYQSMFRYHNTGNNGWSKSSEELDSFDRVCPSKDFNNFINAVIENFPGYYTKLVKPFLKTDYVGKTENLYIDFLDILDNIGEDYSENNILAEHINTSDKRIPVAYKKNQIDAILENEKWVVKKYYDNYRIPGLE